MEIDRLERYGHPFTLAYIDLDNFKQVNDQFGHNMGDQVLQVVVHSAEKYMRKTDVIARLGGDEFALLLPETGQETAQSSLRKLQNGLLGAMRQNHWLITFSIGALTCNAAPGTAMELVRLADGLMYSAKRDGKNTLKFASYPGYGPEPAG
jgi:diguanylate cyclase (GGDEF)-like protein